jgi:hypothetical protein
VRVHCIVISCLAALVFPAYAVSEDDTRLVRSIARVCALTYEISDPERDCYEPGVGLMPCREKVSVTGNYTTICDGGKTLVYLNKMNLLDNESYDFHVSAKSLHIRSIRKKDALVWRAEHPLLDGQVIHIGTAGCADSKLPTCLEVRKLVNLEEPSVPGKSPYNNRMEQTTSP